jgi:DNA-binding transcriptional regulator of glucitol operon
MRAFWSGVLAAVLIAVIAALALNWMDWSSAAFYTSPQGNVRL